jgi:hypothetical protein
LRIPGQRNEDGGTTCSRRSDPSGDLVANQSRKAEIDYYGVGPHFERPFHACRTVDIFVGLVTQSFEYLAEALSRDIIVLDSQISAWLEEPKVRVG